MSLQLVTSQAPSLDAVPEGAAEAEALWAEFDCVVIPPSDPADDDHSQDDTLVEADV